MHPLVLQSDFGLDDGAVSAMYGVALGVAPQLRVHDLTHNIPPYDIHEGSYRLAQVVQYWPEGTVFVSVVDPGVGSDRLSVVARTASGHLVVTPNNGTLTHVDRFFGLDEVRIIDETANRLQGSAESYTFHGRDVYAYTGARLAAGIIDFADVGAPVAREELVTLPVDDPVLEDGAVHGAIDALDVRYGSLWTSIPRPLFRELGVEHGDRVTVRVMHHDVVVHAAQMRYVPSFASVEIGESLLYVNSLDRMAIAINRGHYARAFSLGTGASWRVSLRPAP
ncbi:S-adenosyl-l-methionine hydroxide adenosyltransferase family protein [Brachybacterium sp. EF45031]|uniref:SAM hydrolase/SAM-dependent halogenase family protein n=1 Tax=Brachybacterium sillae TaxID=2810536 RepID=UPI00217D0CD3|nr:S-adenosyl-l-methionine hydroxide adenosyltransferase family protein [Brachybacterium sillae]MCS6711427.1 S-adenosyl-l-methionine hydroxide adenosyltransferase family protein [Brachybacterium sillae]